MAILGQPNISRPNVESSRSCSYLAQQELQSIIIFIITVIMMACREVAGALNIVSETKEMLAGKCSICSSKQDLMST